MDRDIDSYVKQCDSCAKFKAGRPPIAPLGELKETTFPFEIILALIRRPDEEIDSLLYLSITSVVTRRLFPYPGTMHRQSLNACYRDLFKVRLPLDTIIR
jgi:hypothetical protein